MRSKDRRVLAHANEAKRKREAGEPGLAVFQLLGQTDRRLERLCWDVKDVPALREQRTNLRALHIQFVGEVLLSRNRSTSVDRVLRSLELHAINLDDMTREFIGELMRLLHAKHSPGEAARMLRARFLAHLSRQESAA